MNFLNYIFWKTTRYRIKKDGFDFTYLKAILLFELVFITIPTIITQPTFLGLAYIAKLNTSLRYLFFFPLVILSALPFWFIFPKEKIRNLNFSDADILLYNKKISYVIVFMLFLFVLRIVYVKCF